MAEEVEERTPLYKADKLMRQPTGKTFHDWARIRPARFQDYFLGGPDANINALTNAVTIDDFEDAVSSYFAIKTKAKDPDKLFPRETRIELLKAEVQNRGSTSKPEGYDQSGNNAGYKFWVHKTFQYRPTTAFQFKSRLIQHPGLLYFKETEKNQHEIVEKWNKLDPPSDLPPSQAPVTSVENSYVDYLQAHIYRAQDKNGKRFFVHRGRDETYAQLKMGISSCFAKKLVTDINWKCPTCEPRMREASKTGKMREKERSNKRKAEDTGEETPTKKRQVKRLVKSSPSTPPAPIQQPLQENDFENSYFPQSTSEYPQENDFWDVYPPQSATEYQPPRDHDTEHSNLLAPPERTPSSQDYQNNGPGDVHWKNYEGYSYYYLHCPPNHRLRWDTITMSYRGTVEIMRLGESAKHTPYYSSLPAELFNISLPPGIHFYNNPGHPYFLDCNTGTVCINFGQPMEPIATTPPLQTVAGMDKNFEQVQPCDLPIDLATIFAAESLENSPTNPPNNNVSELSAHDKSIHNMDPQLSPSGEVSDPSLADQNASIIEPVDKILIEDDDDFLAALQNYIAETNFVQENNVGLFSPQLYSNSDIFDTNNNIFDTNNNIFDTNNNIFDMNSNIFDANSADPDVGIFASPYIDFEPSLEKAAGLSIREQEDETADAELSLQCPISQPIIDPSGLFQTLNGLTLPIPASSRGLPQTRYK